MPSREKDTTPLVPRSSVLAQATSTTAAAIAIPGWCRCIDITGAAVKHHVAVGTASSAPALTTSNAGIVQAGATVTVYPHPTGHTHLYVQTTSSTGTVDVTFYG